MATFKWHNHVWNHGPTYVTDRAVLLVLVDRMSDDGWVRRYSVGWIADRAGISERTCHTRLRALEQAQWIKTESGGGRHQVSAYLVNVGKLNGNHEETMKELHGINHEETMKQTSETMKELHTSPFVPTTPSRSSELGDELPLLVAMPDDDDISERELVRVALDGILTKPTRSWIKAVIDAVGRGWNASTLNAHIHERIAAVNGGRIDLGLVRTILREDEPAPAAQPRPAPANICEHGVTNGSKLTIDGDSVGNCHQCQERHAKHKADFADYLASLPRCPHGIPGGDTVADSHGTTFGGCRTCEATIAKTG